MQAAHVLAGRLAERAEPGPDGLHWRMAAGWEYLMPGFSHGTAGVAYALAAAGRGSAAATWWMSPSAAPAPFSPSGTIPAAGRCRSRYHHDRAARR